MGYQKIPNLKRDFKILEICKQVYCLEKIHGTSSHIAFRDDKLNFYAGGVPYDVFIKLFDHDRLLEAFRNLGHNCITIFGESYGGKLQKMTDVYGPELKFVAFEVKIRNVWLNVQQAEKVARSLGFDFVFYNLVEATVEAVNAERDRPSTQALKNGMGPDKWSEGVVVRPVVELMTGDGKRLLAKHRRSKYEETKTTRELSMTPEERALVKNARDVSEEFVTDMRLQHVVDQYLAAKHEADHSGQYLLSVKDTGPIVRLMIDDIVTEHGDEIVWSKEVGKLIGAKTAAMFGRKTSIFNNLYSMKVASKDFLEVR